MHILLGALVLFLLFLTSLYSYLLFHSIAEIFSIFVAFSIFMVAWNSREYMKNNYLIFLGAAYLFIGILDLIHTLAYKGMGIFPMAETNLPTQLWVSARYMEAVSLFLAPLFIEKKVRIHLIPLSYAVVTAALLASIFYWRNFPACFIDGSGLTPFKVFSEYIICLILAAAVLLLFRKRARFDRTVFYLLISSIVLTILAELSFTAYVHAYGLINMIGHFFKIISFYLIYLAFIHTGLREPYRLLFRDLTLSQESLKKANDMLETRVRERTAELAEANEKLRAEMSERRQIMDNLRESEAKYTVLIESSLTGVYIVQQDKIIFANTIFESIYGYSRDEILGMDYSQLIHPEDRDKVRESYEKLMNGSDDIPAEYESKGLTKDGRTIWISRRNRLITYNGGPAILGNIIDITEKKHMEEALVQSEKDLRFLSSQLLSAEEKERKRIARDIHDGISQLLSTIKFNIENGVLLLEGKAPEPSLKPLMDAISLTKGTMEEVRRIVMDLRPSTLDELGILPTLSWYCREYQNLYSRISIEQDIRLEESDVPKELKTVIFRVFQEALNNIAKHSQAGSIRFHLKKEDDTIRMIVVDDGSGFNVEAALSRRDSKKGFGLTSMRERTELSGGTFSIESVEGGGTTITAVWPA